MKIIIRQAEPSDHAFIYATYIRHNWFRKNNKTTLKRSTWSTLTHNVLEKVLSEDRAYVACLDDEPDHIVGYGLNRPHPFTYVKLEWRQYSPSISDMLLERLQ